jgi:hypothetical protein
MSKSNPIVFQWEASDNPNDPEGVATFKCGGISVSVALHDFATASRLSRLIQSAYQLGRHNAIDKVSNTIPAFLREQRYD